MTDQARWWQSGVIYQIYPRSFMDGDGDGIGDLAGITSRLDFLRWLGVDAIWVSPFYPSPMADFGYDVSDYTAVDPIFGTLEDFDRLLEQAHRRGLRLIIDFVPNHTSEQHPWFRESRSSRDSPKRDWYIWRDPAPDGGPPNNWQSAFGGSTWEWDEATGQYYYHAFLREQPDLNWRNPEVEAAMFDVIRFWLDRGVDGLRVDAVQNLIKDEQLRDNPPNSDFRPGDDPYDALLHVHSRDQPGVHQVIARMRRLVDGYPGDRALIGEIYNSVERLMPYYGVDGAGCHFPYNFQLIRLPWRAREIEETVRRYEELLPPGAWPNWVLGNHDRARVATRAGAAQARVAAMLLLTLRGTPTMYYGDEIGMRNVPVPPERVRDPWEKNVPGFGRDPVRTPMQWDGSRGAAFTSGEPWLPIADDADRVNVAAQRRDPTSLLSLYRRLLELRRAEPALHVGSFEPVCAPGELLAYLREHDGRRLLVALNLGGEAASLPARGLSGRIALSTHLDRQGEAVEAEVPLRADEGVVVEIQSVGRNGLPVAVTGPTR